MEPQKPFACTLPDCGMTFTNEDHLHVHTKKHDMVLQLGMEQKAAFVADQTPTPTRFIRNCEEVGLFQDLQHVNPFDEGFRKAMETKHGILSLEGTSTEDVLHTPHLVYPLEPGDCAQYTANNQRNITISRSSSDESGAVKEYETTTISKLTNEVTTISRVVKDVERKTTDDVSIRHDTRSKDRHNETVYTNNVIKIQSNVEIRNNNTTIDASKEKNLPPIMSQKSLDFVLDSLTESDTKSEDTKHDSKKSTDPKQSSKNSDDIKKLDDYEVYIKLPNGKRVKMKAVEEEKTVHSKTKQEILKKIIKSEDKTNVPKTSQMQNVIPIQTGTLIPVTVLCSPLQINNSPLIGQAAKIPIAPMPNNFKTVKRKSNDSDKSAESDRYDPLGDSRSFFKSRNAASKRYREKLKNRMSQLHTENRSLRECNQRLAAEKAVLKLVIMEHLKKCPIGDDLRNIQEKLENASINNSDL